MESVVDKLIRLGCFNKRNAYKFFAQVTSVVKSARLNQPDALSITHPN
jgi:hypothetical protein